MHSLCLNLTDSCNLRCSYCFCVKQPHYMDLQVAKDAVDFLLKECPNKKPSITFFGGEPTLCWDTIIVPLVEYTNNRINFDITTNGTLLNQERIDFLKENNIPILLSIDGDTEVQNKTRPLVDGGPSAPMVQANIPLILTAFPHTTFRATISTDNVKYLFNSFLYAIKQGFKSMFFTVNEREKWLIEQIQILEEELNKIHFYIASILLSTTDKLPFRINLWDDYVNEIKMINEGKVVAAAGQRCGLGSSSASVGWDGTLYACQEATSWGKDNNIFYIGDIYNGYDNSKLSEQYNKTKNYLPYPDCDSCLRKNFCLAKTCITANYEVSHNLNEPSYISCVFNNINLKQTNYHLKMIYNNTKEEKKNDQ